LIRCWTQAGCPENGELEAIVHLDPALAFFTLRICNSPFFGLQGKVSTLRHARALLGSDPLKGIVLGAATRAGADANRSIMLAADPGRFWAHSIHVAHLARVLARLTEYDLPEEAYVAGLLHDTGKSLEQAARKAERASRNDAHAASGAGLARACHFPRGLAAAIAHHHDPPRRLARLARRTRILTALVSAADLLAYRARGDEAEAAARIAGHSGAEHLQFLAIPEEARLEAQREAEVALLESLRCGSDPPASLDEVYSGSASPQDVPLDGDLFVERGETLSATIQFVNQVMRDVRSKATWEEVIDAVLYLLHRNLGFDRALYFECNRNGRSLVLARCHEDTNFTPRVDGLRFPLGKGEATVTHVLKDLRAGIARDPAVDGSLLDLFGTSAVGFAPVVVKRQVVGLISIDQFARASALGERELGILDLLAAKTGMILENLQLANQGQKLRRIAQKDPLTGINNRRYCIDLFRKEIDRARRYAAPLSVALIDLDHFKEFNDLYGHSAGDRVLREVARLLESNSRRTDVIGRFGGDEFLVILPQITPEQAITYAERVRTKVTDFSRSLRKRYPRCNLAISIGVAPWRKGARIEEIITAADKALYAAKERGRNRVCATD